VKRNYENLLKIQGHHQTMIWLLHKMFKTGHSINRKFSIPVVKIKFLKPCKTTIGYCQNVVGVLVMRKLKTHISPQDKKENAPRDLLHIYTEHHQIWLLRKLYEEYSIENQLNVYLTMKEERKEGESVADGRTTVATYEFSLEYLYLYMYIKTNLAQKIGHFALHF
jgi:hypothetical protein